MRLKKNEMPDDLPVDTTWDHLYSAGTGSTGVGASGYDDQPVYQGETTQTLYDYLKWQLELTPFSENDHVIAMAIIDAVDDQGYLSVSTDDILESLGSDEIELDEVEAVLKRVQHFDPLGIAARSLQECLMLQLATYDDDTPWLAEARKILTEHMAYLPIAIIVNSCEKHALKSPI